MTTPEFRATLNRQMLGGFLWLLSSSVVWQIVSWLATIVTARILEPEDYGLLAMSEAIFPYLLLVTTLKIDGWIERKISFEETERRAVLGLLVASGLVWTICAFFGATLVANFYREPKVELPLQVMSIIFIMRSLQVLPEAELRRTLQFKRLAIMNIALGVSRCAIQVVLAYAGFRYWALVAGGVYREVAAVIWLFWLSRFSFRMEWKAEIVRGVLQFCIPATAGAVLWTVYSTSDNIIVGRLFGKEQMGFYVMAFFLAELPISKLNSVLSPMVVPYLSRFRGDRQEFSRAFVNLVRFIQLCVSPVLILLAATAEPFIELLLGAKWLGIVPALKVFCIVGILRAFSVPLAPLFFAVGLPSKSLQFTAWCCVVMPASFYLTGSVLGLPGIYLTWLIIFPVFCLPVQFWLMGKVLNNSLFKLVEALVRPLAAASLAVLACEELVAQLKIESIVVGLLSFWACFGVLYLIVLALIDFSAIKAAIQLAKFTLRSGGEKLA